MSMPTEEALRAEVRSWLEANWDPDRELVAWRNLLIDAGWGAPTWPERWHGRGLSPELAQVVDEEIRRIGALGVAPPGRAPGRSLRRRCWPHGSDLPKKERFLRRSLTGEEAWCQLFSEPGSRVRPRPGRDHPRGVQGRTLGVGERPRNCGRPAPTMPTGACCLPAPIGTSSSTLWAQLFPDRHAPGGRRGAAVAAEMNGHASFNQVFFTDAQVAARASGGRAGRRLAGRHDDADARAPRLRRLQRGRRSCLQAHGPRPRGEPAPRRRRPWSPTSGIRSAPGGWT